jgi:hypothetical protein
MKEIKLTQGKVAIVDDDDYDRIVEFGSWHFMNIGYAGSCARRQKTYLHRFIFGLNPGDKRVVDHIDGNKLNCQKSNMRVCEVKQNLANRGLNKNNTSGFKGVTFDKQKGKWCAKIQVNRKYMFCGYGETPAHAALKYNDFATKYFGEFAVLNNVNS